MCKLAYKETAIDLAMDLFQEGKEKGYTEQILADKIGCSPYETYLKNCVINLKIFQVQI